MYSYIHIAGSGLEDVGRENTGSSIGVLKVSGSRDKFSPRNRPSESFIGFPNLSFKASELLAYPSIELKFLSDNCIPRSNIQRSTLRSDLQAFFMVTSFLMEQLL